MYVGRRYIKRNDTNEGAVTMAVSVTLRFDFSWNDSEMDENDIRECLMELSPEELLVAANNAGEPINIDIEVY